MGQPKIMKCEEMEEREHLGVFGLITYVSLAIDFIPDNFKRLWAWIRTKDTTHLALAAEVALILILIIGLTICIWIVNH